MTDIKINMAYTTLLTTLYKSRQPGAKDRTGSLDRFGRVVAGPAGSLLPGDAVAWLWLMAHGYVIPAPLAGDGMVECSGRGVKIVLDAMARKGEAA